MRNDLLVISADCDAGFYPDPSDNSTCIEVPVGTYKTASGSGTYTACQSGFSTVLNGSSDPSLCHSKLSIMIDFHKLIKCNIHYYLWKNSQKCQGHKQLSWLTWR